jgi:GTP-binding protein
MEMPVPEVPTVSIVGRPNVGKSALFNRLVGRRVSIVHNMPGVTRDRLAVECQPGDRTITLVDTGGIGSVVDAAFSEQVSTEAEIAIETSSVILFVVDAMAGLHPVDEDLARRLRKTDKPLILVVNKVDHEKHRDFDTEFTRLGFKYSVAVSAEHNRGIDELISIFDGLLPQKSGNEGKGERRAAPKIAIVGRPNVGKSSLINAVLKDSRTMVSEISGTTRDAIDVPYRRDEIEYVLIDTAGIRPKGRQADSVEVFSVMRSERSIHRADLCVLVVDAVDRVTSQDKRIAGMIQEAKKPCVVAINKWDLVKPEPGVDRKSYLKNLLQDLRAELFFVDYAPFILLSAVTGENLSRLFRFIEQVRSDSRNRIGTGPLNRLLHSIIETWPPPMRGGKRFKIIYATMTEKPGIISIPQVVLFVNTPEVLTANYRKFLENKIREKGRYMGLPLLLEMRGRETRKRN